jgi:RsiW-degrading membrane proteinase PrsW (M82 family)
MLLVRTVGFIAAGALLWMLYFERKDSLKPEPRRMLLLAWACGCGSALLALALYWLAGRLGLPSWPGEGRGEIALYCLALVGPVEEGAKFLAARLLVFRWRHFDERIDGMVYAGAVAIGFATVENLLYAQLLPWPQQLVRAVISPLTHTLFAAIWGFGTAHALLVCRTRAGRLFWQLAPLALAMAAHGLYDFFLLAFNATLPASAVILLLWVGLIFYSRRLIRIEKAKD